MFRVVRSKLSFRPILECIFSGILIAFACGCGGVDSGGGGTFADQNSTAFRSLRLGQTDSPGSPVATTAGINNGESIIVLNRAPGSIDVSHVLYSSQSGDVARITFDEIGLPSEVQTRDARAIFSNFTVRSVDIVLETNANIRPAVTVALPAGLDAFVPKNVRPSRVSSAAIVSRAVESPEVLDQLLRAAVFSVRTFGCAGSQAGVQGGAPPSFQKLADQACISLLVNVIQGAISESLDLATLLVEGLNENQGCDFSSPGWLSDFSQAEMCAQGVGDELIAVVRSVSPTLVSVVDPNNDGVPGGTPSGPGGGTDGGTDGGGEQPGPSPGGNPGETPGPTANETPGGDNGGGNGGNDGGSEPDPDPTAEPTPEPTPNCGRGIFECADGALTCNEFACNGINDCGDGSDESSALCTVEVVCCINSNGCPGESADACAPTCCCCGALSSCGAAPYFDGCVGSSARKYPSARSVALDPLLELVFSGEASF